MVPIKPSQFHSVLRPPPPPSAPFSSWLLTDNTCDPKVGQTINNRLTCWLLSGAVPSINQFHLLILLILCIKIQQCQSAINLILCNLDIEQKNKLTCAWNIKQCDFFAMDEMMKCWRKKTCQEKYNCTIQLVAHIVACKDGFSSKMTFQHPTST